MNEETQAATPQWFKTVSYLILASLLVGAAGIIIALIVRVIRWILA